MMIKALWSSPTWQASCLTGERMSHRKLAALEAIRLRAGRRCHGSPGKLAPIGPGVSHRGRGRAGSRRLAPSG
jgi:hypothetical protein